MTAKILLLRVLKVLFEVGVVGYLVRLRAEDLLGMSTKKTGLS